MSAVPQSKETVLSRQPRTDDLRPMTPVQIQQTRDFVESLAEDCATYWDMVQIGDELSRELEITPELVILYADAVEDYNSWYEGWRMNTGRIEGGSPFGPAIVPPLMVSHLVLSGAVRSHETVCDRVDPYLSRLRDIRTYPRWRHGAHRDESDR